MSESPPNSRAWPVALAVLAALSCAYVLTHRLPGEAQVVEGRFVNCIPIDSEHGLLNGWFSPEVVYDVYVSTDDGRQFVIWATPDTAFYRERGGDLVRVSARDFEKGAKVRAHLGQIDESHHRPSAYGVRLVAVE